MPIRTKALLSSGAAIALSIGLFIFMTYQVLLRNLTTLEQKHASQNVQRVRSAFDNYIADMSLKVTDWSAWDDTYSYIQNPDPEYIRSNFTDVVFQDMRFNLVAYYGAGGRLVYAEQHDLVKNRRVATDKNFLAAATGRGRFLKHKNALDTISGVIIYNGTPVAISSNPIVTTDKTSPVRGSLVVARILNSGEASRLAQLTHMQTSLYPSASKSLPGHAKNAIFEMQKLKTNTFVAPLDRKTNEGFTQIKGLDGTNALLIRILIPRDMHELGVLGARRFVAIFAIIGLMSVLFILILLERVILGPLSTLARQVTTLGKDGDATARLDARGKDELSAVSSSINTMLDSLETAHKELALQHALGESEERYRGLVELSPDSVFIIGAANKIIFANAAALNLAAETDYSAILGKPITAVLNPEDAPRFNQWLLDNSAAAPGSPERPRLELLLTRRNGTTIQAELAAASYEYQGENATQIIARDITERIKTEQRIERANQCFLSFGSNPDDNIALLADLCGQTLGAAFAFYARLQNNRLHTTARWRAPRELPEEFDPLLSPAFQNIRDNNPAPLITHGPAATASPPCPIATCCGARTLVTKTVQFHNGTAGALCAAFNQIENPLEDDLKFMTIIAAAVAVEEQRRVAEHKVQRRIETEHKISTISSRFMHSEDIEYSLSATLEDIGEMSRAANVFLFVMDDNGNEIINTLQWCDDNSGDGAYCKQINNIASSQIPWSVATMKRGESIVITDTSKAPPEAAAEAALIGQQPASALILLPYFVENRLSSFIGFTDLAHPEVLPEDIAIYRVITEIIGSSLSRKGAEGKLRYLAYNDSLTGIPNRFTFSQMLDMTIGRKKTAGETFAVLLLDLDRFKEINDTLGHAAGDRILKTVADRLKAVIRHNDFLARYSGDEFLIILDDIQNEQQAQEQADLLYAAVSEPFNESGHEFYITPSIGISIYPAGGETPEDLIMNADMAMYLAKENTGSQFSAFFTTELRTTLTDKKTIENELRKALPAGELELHYQPQIELETGRILGAEALIRWNRPGHGMVLPAAFIPIAEETGLIIPIGEWVIRTACEQNKKWQDLGLPPVRVGVNLSARQFLYQNLTQLIPNILEETGLPPQWLDIEITESIAMQNIETTLAILTHLRELGIHISLDDFGTGYSSLSYLRLFPITTVKIAGDFLHDILHGKGTRAIIQAIIAMSHTLGRRVIAEEVETPRQAEFLIEDKCDEVQGYLFSRPVPASKFQKLLENGAVIEP